MRQTGSRDDIVRRIGSKVQCVELQTNLARIGPDLKTVHRRGERCIVQPLNQPS